ncbi:MAG: hypothetical protein HYY96_15670 [Candidatus Tectomicrobia bacterium]|nr:hypothetical protein [Candidatus Tectomicrobia bacterium]
MKGRCFAMLVMVMGVGLLLAGPAVAGDLGGCSHFSSAKLEVASAPVETPMTPVDGNSIVVAQATAPAQPCAPKKEAAQPCAPKTTDAAQPCAAKKTDAAQPCAPKKTDAAQPCAPKK